VLAIKHLRKINLGLLQGKQDDQVFVLKIIINNILKNVLFLLSVKNRSLNGETRVEYKSYTELVEVRKEIRGQRRLKIRRSNQSEKRRKDSQISENFLKHKQIDLILRKQGVHPNPGPRGAVCDLSFMTYNCRGLRDVKKLRRILAKLSKLVKQNYIIALQETHKVEDKQLSLYWKDKYIMNCNKTNKGGVILLFSNEYQINEVYKDEEDRFIIAEIASEKYKLIIGNVYYPNDHRSAIVFSEKVYSKVLEFQYNSAEAYTCLMGDINHCLSDRDSVNRKVNVTEKELVKVTNSNNETCNLRDSYRILEGDGGYTWSRGNCFSRLDYIFISEELRTKVIKVGLDWCLEKSDHAGVVCNLKIGKESKKGPGIVKLNVNLLNDEESRLEINKQTRELLSQMPEDWNPHTKLEYTKMSIRSVFANVGGIFNNEKNTEIKDIEDQINRMNQIRELEILKEEKDISKELLKMIAEANKELSGELEKLRTKYSEDLAFKSGVKWYEEGEKSNKYFLGLMKIRSRQKEITEIRNNGEVICSQEGIVKCIKDFYKNLYRLNVRKANKDISFFNLCPKLSEDRRRDLDREITVDELRRTLKDCKESAPGPDGITYNIYRHLWPLVGNIITNSWNFSVETGIMPPSHLESALTLLPKEGKDQREIKNWRPITLSNCDSKIITKTLANRMSKHLETIIDPAQTAYIPGRSVMDNMRSNLLIKNYCSRNRIGGVLIALDAKKAFDSVSHQYILDILDAYGVGERFKLYFKVLYNKIDVRVMVNGYFSDKINIERGVKQGDALSCSLFILCMDPLIRNINANNKIEAIEVKGVKVKYKASGYADDIAVICKNTISSIQGIFNEYERLTNLSGLELNADKTELLQLGSSDDRREVREISYCGERYKIEQVESIKICGIYFCTDNAVEYDNNILAKIEKLEIQLKRWMCRNLTLEGKILIIKTYGLSQLIYNLQCYEIIERDIKVVERLIFKFIWCKEWAKTKWNERIRRRVLKNEYEEGGLKAPDIECLNKALKLRQVIRASKGKHPISKLQSSGESSQEMILKQEYRCLNPYDSVVRSAQTSINLLTDNLRQEMRERTQLGENSRIVINMMGSIDIAEYLGRKKDLLAECWFKKLKEEGIEVLGQLIQEIEYTNEPDKLSMLKFIEKRFPKEILDSARNFSFEINERENLTHIYLGNDFFSPVGEVTVKQLQVLLKKCLGKVESPDYNNKLEISNFDKQNIIEVRRQIHNVQLRNIFYRLINKDFFTKVRMLRYKMVPNNECEKCAEVEDYKHLIWECYFVRKTWKNLNNILKINNLECDTVNSYQDLFNFRISPATNTIRLKIIQHFIQIK